MPTLISWLGLALIPIEAAWPYLKRETTKKGTLIACLVAEKAWTKAWKDLEQWRIQLWIRRIRHHVKEIIRCKGGNKYIEGNEKPIDRVIKCRRPICVS